MNASTLVRAAVDDAELFDAVAIGRTKRSSGAVKSQSVQWINSAMTEMRHKLTRKYNLEFLTTAERPTASSHRGTRHNQA